MWKRAKTALLGLLLVSSGVFAQVPEDLPEEPDSPIVKVTLQSGTSGSGVVIRQVKFPNGECQEWVLTAAHVVAMNWLQDKTTYWPAVIYETSNYLTAALVVGYDHRYDLALLKYVGDGCIADFAVPVADEYIPHGTPIWLAGWLWGQELAILPGVIGHYRGSTWYAEMEGPNMFVAGPARPGMSGGAIMQGRKLHGMISGQSPQLQFYTVAIPAWRIQQFLDIHGEKEA